MTNASMHISVLASPTTKSIRWAPLSWQQIIEVVHRNGKFIRATNVYLFLYRLKATSETSFFNHSFHYLWLKLYTKYILYFPFIAILVFVLLEAFKNANTYYQNVEPFHQFLLPQPYHQAPHQPFHQLQSPSVRTTKYGEYVCLGAKVIANSCVTATVVQQTNVNRCVAVPRG